MDKITSKVPKKKLKKRTKFTILAVFNIIWYAIVDMILTYNGTPLPSDLTIAWFTAWTVELALLYGIKVKSKDSSEEYSEDYKMQLSMHTMPKLTLKFRTRRIRLTMMTL